MIISIPPRLRRPLGLFLAGTVLAAAWAVRGSPAYWAAIATWITCTGSAVALYVHAGDDTDEGALAGSRADERQQILRTRSRALAGSVVTAAAFTGLTITVAARSPEWWPFAVILGLALFGYLFGLSAYGTPEDDPADDGAASSPAHSAAG